MHLLPTLPLPVAGMSVFAYWVSTWIFGGWFWWLSYDKLLAPRPAPRSPAPPHPPHTTPQRPPPDSLSYLVPALTTLSLIGIFDIDAFLKDGALPALLWLLLLFGPAVASFTYCMSFLFSSHSSALIWVLFINCE